MKILFIHNAYGKYCGEEAVVDAQIALLQDNGYKVHAYIRSSVELEQMHFGKVRSFFTGLYNAEAIKEIKQLIKEIKPDIVHVHNLYPLISPAVLSVLYRLGIPIVMTVHNYRLLCPNGLFFTNGEVCERCIGAGKELHSIIHNCELSMPKSLGYALRNFLARISRNYLDNVDAFLCLTEFQRKKLIEGGYAAEKCKVLPNFIDIEEIVAVDHQREFVLFVGRLNSQKGFDVIINAASMLPSVTFKIAGKGDSSYLKKLNIPNNVILLGSCNKDQMHDLYKKAFVLVFSSRSYEGFPMVFLEAMGNRVPIIAPNMAGYPEIVEDGRTGLLFEPGNAKVLASAIQQLVTSTELATQLAEEAFKKLKLQYSSDVYYKRLVEVYTALCKRNLNSL